MLSQAISGCSRKSRPTDRMTRAAIKNPALRGCRGGFVIGLCGKTSQYSVGRLDRRYTLTPLSHRAEAPSIVALFRCMTQLAIFSPNVLELLNFFSRVLLNTSITQSGQFLALAALGLLTHDLIVRTGQGL